MKRVVVTSVGMLTAAGCSGTYLQTLRRNKNFFKMIPFPTKAKAEIAAFVTKPMAMTKPRVLSLAECALEECIGEMRTTLGTEVGISLGTAVGDTIGMEKFFLDSGQDCSFTFDFITNSLAKSFDFKGPRFTITTGCTAGIDAIGIAFDQVRLGKATAMIAGAAEAPISPIVIASFDKIGALSKRNSVNDSSQPFGIDRDGFVLGEGAAFLLLEDLEHALARKAKPLAEIKEWHSLQSAYHMTSMRVNGDDLVDLIFTLLNNAEVLPEQIDLVDAHGTSTEINDLTEAVAFGRVFKNRSKAISISAQKSFVGHLLGASNAIEIVGLCRMIAASAVPGMCNTKMFMEELPLNATSFYRDDYEIRNAIKLSSGFSGIHSAMLLSQWKQ